MLVPWSSKTVDTAVRGFFTEFKEFAVKGNMVDMAIGVIIGAAFNKVINVIVKEVFMPVLSILTGGYDFSDMKYVMRATEVGPDGAILAEEVAIKYGHLIDVLLDFFIIALTVFLVVKLMNRLKKKGDDTSDDTVATPKDIELLDEMTKLLKEQNEILRKPSPEDQLPDS